MARFHWRQLTTNSGGTGSPFLPLFRPRLPKAGIFIRGVSNNERHSEAFENRDRAHPRPRPYHRRVFIGCVRPGQGA